MRFSSLVLSPRPKIFKKTVQNPRKSPHSYRLMPGVTYIKQFMMLAMNRVPVPRYGPTVGRNAALGEVCESRIGAF